MKHQESHLSRHDKWNMLADKIEKLDPTDHLNQKTTRGMTVAESIIGALREGNIELAKSYCFSESDKFGSQREKIKELLIEELFEGKDHPWHITNPWK